MDLEEFAKPEGFRATAHRGKRLFARSLATEIDRDKRLPPFMSETVSAIVRRHEFRGRSTPSGNQITSPRQRSTTAREKTHTGSSGYIWAPDTVCDCPAARNSGSRTGSLAGGTGRGREGCGSGIAAMAEAPGVNKLRKACDLTLCCRNGWTSRRPHSNFSGRSSIRSRFQQTESTICTEAHPCDLLLAVITFRLSLVI
jgi:hypothetical protein